MKGYFAGSAKSFYVDPTESVEVAVLSNVTIVCLCIKRGASTRARSRIGPGLQSARGHGKPVFLALEAPSVRPWSISSFYSYSCAADSRTRTADSIATESRKEPVSLSGSYLVKE
ncbi:unnamed protein product [Dovyalis caffra]|uniref:Uncharacterized protein n=1 Tax=Dovyalis caffra TaxID=77055 RepID=A0AAV1QU47_9ROSI|nr:unnamed protein product [Dovyalis caffra]